MPGRIWMCFTDIGRCTTIYFISTTGVCPRCGVPGTQTPLPIRPKRQGE